MQAIRGRASVRRCSGRPSIFPSRPDLKTTVLPLRLQQPTHTDALAWSRLCPGSLRGMARIVAAITPLVCPIAALPFFEAGACAQNVSRAEPVDRFAGLIAKASDRFAVPTRWIRAVMQIESAGDKHATSRRGAMGLMQIMPGTWVELSVRYGLGLDPYDPHDNILAGAAYLKQMHDRFGSAGFLAAYHAGPLRYEQHLATGRPLPPETVAYVSVLTPLLASEQNESEAFRIRRAIPYREAPLFIEREDGAFAGDQLAHDARQTRELSDRSTVGSSTLTPLSAGLFVGRSMEGQSR